MVVSFDNIKRIAVVGVSGSGKTTISKKLSKYFELSLYHVDDLIWNNKSEVVHKDEYVSKHKDLINKEEWVIEGYIDEEMVGRLVRADLVIYLDYPRALSVYRYIKRWFISTFNTNSDINQEKLHGNFIAKLMIIVDFFRQTEKKDILGALKSVSKDKIIQVHTSKDMATLISNIAYKFN